MEDFKKLHEELGSGFEHLLMELGALELKRVRGTGNTPDSSLESKLRRLSKQYSNVFPMVCPQCGREIITDSHKPVICGECGKEFRDVIHE